MLIQKIKQFSFPIQSQFFNLQSCKKEDFSIFGNIFVEKAQRIINSYTVNGIQTSSNMIYHHFQALTEKTRECFCRDLFIAQHST